jgi:putative lipoic acid-binding regulatory protein
MSLAQHPEMDFPTIFRLRVIGQNQEDFATFVMVQVRRHVPDLTEDGIDVRESNGGKYLAVKVSFVAESREQLDAIYTDLSNHERVIFLL